MSQSVLQLDVRQDGSVCLVQHYDVVEDHCANASRRRVLYTVLISISLLATAIYLSTTEMKNRRLLEPTLQSIGALRVALQDHYEAE